MDDEEKRRLLSFAEETSDEYPPLAAEEVATAIRVAGARIADAIRVAGDRIARELARSPRD